MTLDESRAQRAVASGHADELWERLRHAAAGSDSEAAPAQPTRA